jgi:nucleotide-binding universal stress UspA family protein
MVRRILVPVDLTVASLHQTRVARELCEALTVPLILVTVVEPLKSGLAARLHLGGVEANRRAVAEEGLQKLLATIPSHLHPEGLVAYGDTAEELAKVAHDRDAGLIVMGLHGSPVLGPRMGSVTYRLLCLASTLVLALPPATAASQTVKHSREGAASGTKS